MSSNLFKPNGIFIYQVSRPLCHLNLRFNELRLKVCQALLESLSRLYRLPVHVAYALLDQCLCCASIPTLQCPCVTCVYEVLKGLRGCRTCATVLYDVDRLQQASHRLKQGLLIVFRGIFVFHCRFLVVVDSQVRGVFDTVYTGKYKRIQAQTPRYAYKPLMTIYGLCSSPIGVGQQVGSAIHFSVVL